MENRGIEPRAFRMQSGRSTTELIPPNHDYWRTFTYINVTKYMYMVHIYMSCHLMYRRRAAVTRVRRTHADRGRTRSRATVIGITRLVCKPSPQGEEPHPLLFFWTWSLFFWCALFELKSGRVQA